jgi:integrase/recombinase XerD
LKIKDAELDEGYIIFNTTKANKVVRVGLEKKIRKDLKEFIARWRLVDADNEPIDSSEYLFCNTFGEQLTRGGLTIAIARYNRRRGVEKTSIHLLRHTFAKNWITSGGDIISLAKVLTHSELDMVKRYSNLYGEDVKAEIEEHSTLAQLRRKSGQTLKTQQKR